MSDKKQIVDRFLKSLDGPSASAEELRESKERLRYLVHLEWNELAHEREAAPTNPPSFFRRKLWIAVPVAASLALFAVLFFRAGSPKLETVNDSSVIGRTAEGMPIRRGEPVRTAAQDRTSIALLDGSRVELGSNVELRVDRSNGGLQVDLSRGVVIVTAAHQASGGHFRVQTKDCTVLVVGTVFSVRAETSGSRVSVFEGRVEVMQGAESHALLPGQQFSTNTSLATVSLQKEIEWSSNAPALISMAAAVAAQQLAPVAGTGAASLEGTVVRQGTNEPIAGAELELSRVEGTSSAPLAPGVAEMFNSILYNSDYSLPAQGTAPPPLLAPEVKYGKTDSDGRFSFRDLKEGKYRLVAVRSGGLYYPAEFGQRDVSQRGLNFSVAAGETKKNVKIEMVPTGAISGRVFDDDGQPMGHVLVMALVPRERAGEVRLEIERVVLTDERGEYRLFWLGPGKYTVAAVYEDPQRRTIETAPTAPPGRTIARQRATSPAVIKQLLPDGSSVEEAYGVVYAGGSMDSRSARMIDVQSAETFAGVDIPMGAGRVRTHHILGIVIAGDTAQPVGGVSVLAIPRQWRPNALVLQGTTKNDGSFDLPGAFAESYVLTATSVPFAQGANVSSRSTPQAGYLVVDVASADVSNARLVMRGATTLTGRVTIEGRASSNSDPDLTKMRISLTRDPDLIAIPQGLLPPPPPPAPAGSPPPRELGPGPVGGNNSFPPGLIVAGPGNVVPGQVSTNGNFTLYVSQGDFRMNIAAGVPAGMYVKSIRMGGEDLLRSTLHVTGGSPNPIEITIGTDGGTIAGTVLDSSGRASTNATVALVPDAPNRTYADLYRNTTSDSDGNFKLTGVAPGNYKVFAWEWASVDSWQNADFIRGYEVSGKNVQVSASGKVEKIQLNVIPGRR